jgi:hypothetical protein
MCESEGAQREMARESTIAGPMATLMFMPYSRPSQAMSPPSLTYTKEVIV